MSLKEFKKVKLADSALTQLQNNIAGFTSQLTNNPILTGNLITGVVLVFGQTTTVNHGLGRKIQGFQIVYKNNSVEVWAEDVNQTLPISNIVLSTSADATVNLWVF